MALYNLILYFGVLLTRIISPFNKKISRFFALRKGEIDRVTNHFINFNRQNKKVIWFHSASAGELEYAKPLIDHYKNNNPDIYIIGSFYSPSGHDAGMKYKSLDFYFNLPVDFRKNAEILLETVKPDVIIFSKCDVWTNLVISAHRRGIKLLLISATLPAKSGRLKFPAKSIFSKSYGLLDRIYAISRDHADRFLKLTGRSENILITGDTRFDRVAAVVKSNEENENILLKEKELFYIIAGSTYKKSERLLIEILHQYFNKKILNNIRLILVPHEIDKTNISRLQKLVYSYQFKPVLFSKTQMPVSVQPDQILIVDAIGILAKLYREADIVYIGGSFKGSVHSVLEPAVFGKPVITGPYIRNSREAIELERSGGLVACSNQKQLSDTIFNLIKNPAYRGMVSRTAYDYFINNIGASENIISDMKQFI